MDNAARTIEWAWPDWSEPDMRLPKWKTCADCANYHACCALFGCKPESRVCDFSPSAFKYWAS
jgi:hypothetical protein